jgi:hypothetical protein
VYIEYQGDYMSRDEFVELYDNTPKDKRAPLKEALKNQDRPVDIINSTVKGIAK